MHRLGKHITFGFEIEAKGVTPKLMEQVHGATVIEVNTVPEVALPADGVYTNQSNFTLSVFTADCIPLLFCTDTKEGPIAAVHAGWRSANAHIAAVTRDLLGNQKLHCIIGPSIHQCCFEIREDFIQAFVAKGNDPKLFIEHRNQRMYFDLLGWVIETQLQGVVLHLEHSRCTYCSLPTLPSFRRNKVTDPRIRSWIRRG